jgi:uncharacterized protein (TIGR02646 family)
VILIRKGAAPAELVTYRAALDTSVDPPRRPRYDGAGFEAVKPAVRAALVRDQRGVCCYCTDRIAPTEQSMKIEHRVPQRGAYGDAERDLDWSNLFGACCGVAESPSGRGAATQHCDSAKADRPLPIDPSDAAHMAAIGYERDGRGTSSRAEHREAIEGVLNLNADVLIERRQRSLDVLKRELTRRFEARAYPKASLEKLRAQLLDPPGDLRPFAGYLAWWIDAAIRSARR